MLPEVHTLCCICCFSNSFLKHHTPNTAVSSVDWRSTGAALCKCFQITSVVFGPSELTLPISRSHCILVSIAFHKQILQIHKQTFSNLLTSFSKTVPPILGTWHRKWNTTAWETNISYRLVYIALLWQVNSRRIFAQQGELCSKSPWNTHFQVRNCMTK